MQVVEGGALERGDAKCQHLTRVPRICNEMNIAFRRQCDICPIRRRQNQHVSKRVQNDELCGHGARRSTSQPPDDRNGDVTSQYRDHAKTRGKDEDDVEEGDVAGGNGDPRQQGVERNTDDDRIRPSHRTAITRGGREHPCDVEAGQRPERGRRSVRDARNVIQQLRPVPAQSDAVARRPQDEATAWYTTRRQ